MGVPWKHQGRLRGVAVDCLGLIVEPLRKLKHPALEGFVWPNYGRLPHRGELEKVCDRYLIRVASEERQVADVALCAWEKYPMHLAWFADYDEHGGVGAPFSLLHAMMDPGRVSEHILDATWNRRIVQVYRVPGVV